MMLVHNLNPHFPERLVRAHTLIVRTLQLRVLTTIDKQVSPSQLRRPPLNVTTSPRRSDSPSAKVAGKNRQRSSTVLVSDHPTPTLSPKSSVQFMDPPKIRKQRSRGEISYHTASRLTSTSPTRSIGSSVRFHPRLKHQSSWAFNDGS